MSKKNFHDLSKDERADLARQVEPIRRDRGLTQQQLADLAGVNRSTIVSMERGGEPQAGKLRLVLEALGVDLDVVEFDEQTQMWLSIMGNLIKAIPSDRRQKHVDQAIHELANGLADPDQYGNVTPIRPIDGGDLEDEAISLGAVADNSEGGPEDDQDQDQDH